MNDQHFWIWEPVFRGVPRNIVFTPDQLIQFLNKYGREKDLWEAAQDLPTHSTRIDQYAFDAGSVVITQPSSLSCFDLTALPIELLMIIVETLHHFRDRMWPKRLLIPLSLTSKRIRNVVAPFLFDQLNLDQRFLDRYKHGATFFSACNKFMEDPAASSICKYINSVTFAPDLSTMMNQEAMWVEEVYHVLEHISKTREIDHKSIVRFSFDWGLFQPEKDLTIQLKKIIERLANLICNLSGLKTLVLTVPSWIAKSFLSQLPTGLGKLIVRFNSFTDVLHCLPKDTHLNILSLPHLPSFDFLTCPISNIKTLLLASGNSAAPTDFRALYDILSICKETLEVLEITGKVCRKNEWLSAREGRGILTFNRLTVLRLSNLWTGKNEHSINSEQQQSSYCLKLLITDFFSLAPIRHFYFRGISDGQCQHSNPCYDDGPLWDGLVGHRVRNKSGWRRLELVVANPWIDEKPILLQGVGIVVKHNVYWPTPDI